jgi:hypothetical protein
MASEDSKDMLKNVDWKTVGGAVTTESSQPVIKKRLPKKIRQVPECYFLPRRSLPSALAIYGAVCAAGVGAGMLLEVWINKKIKGTWKDTHSIFLRIYSSTKFKNSELLVYFANIPCLISFCMQRMVALSGRWINDVHHSLIWLNLFWHSGNC